MNRPIYKLHDWIDHKKLNWNSLSENPKAIDLLKSKPYIINWFNLSNNKNVIDLIEKNQYKINLIDISHKNTALYKISGYKLSANKLRIISFIKFFNKVWRA